jgi:uncharacterized membrane protein YdjX (TVP38/TMEM64 family)
MRKKYYYTFGFLLLLFTVFGSSVFLQGAFENLVTILDTYQQTHTFFGPFIFIGLAALSVMLGPFTSTPLLPFAVAVWGTDRTLLYLLSGWLVGNSLAYAIGYFLGYPLAKKFFQPEEFAKWTSLLSRRVDIFLAFLFRLSTPSETGYIFGTLKYNFFKYFFITLLAELPFAIITVYAGQAFVNAGWKTFVSLGLLWLIVLYFAITLLNKRIKLIKDEQ